MFISSKIYKFVPLIFFNSESSLHVPEHVLYRRMSPTAFRKQIVPLTLCESRNKASKFKVIKNSKFCAFDFFLLWADLLWNIFFK